MKGGRQNRIKLERELNNILEQLNYSETVRQPIVDDFVSRNFARGRISGLLTKSIPLQMAQDVELCLICLHAEKLQLIKTEDYFTEKELKETEDYKLEIKEKSVLDSYTFEDVIKVSETQYMVVVTPQIIQELNNKGIVTYNPRTQRQSDKKVIGGRIVTTMNIASKKTKEIAKTLINKKPITNFISLNILANGSEEWKYFDHNKTLWFKATDVSRLNLLDGAHRFCGILEALLDEPDLDYKIVLNIFHYNEDTARSYVFVTDKQTPLDELYSKSMNEEDVYMVMTNEIKSFGNSKTNEMFSRLTTDEADIIYGLAYTMVDIFSMAIENNFDPKKNLQPIDRMKIKKFLIEGFNYIVGTFKKEFEFELSQRKIDVDERQKQDNIITESNTFVGYIALLSQLYNTPNWEDILLETLSSIDFSKSDKWDKVGVYNKKLTKTTIKKISDHFISYIKQPVSQS
jgi:hypothetical protein